MLKQTKKPDKIFINIPGKYERFKEVIRDDQIPKFNNNVVEIVTDGEKNIAQNKIRNCIDKIINAEGK